MLNRLLDVSFSITVGLLLLLPYLLVCIAMRLTSKGPVLYWSDRVGKNNRLFKMPKIRTMKLDAPQVATHLLLGSDRYLTPIGRYLRKSSLDEIPQLYSILIGEMSLVGPRPALFNQKDLIDLRTKMGVSSLVPGLTGWAQINGRDELSVEVKVAYDVEYLKKKSFIFDIKILLLTLYSVIKSDGVSH